MGLWDQIVNIFTGKKYSEVNEEFFASTTSNVGYEVSQGIINVIRAMKKNRMLGYKAERVFSPSGTKITFNFEKFDIVLIRTITRKKVKDEIELEYNLSVRNMAYYEDEFSQKRQIPNTVNYVIDSIVFVQHVNEGKVFNRDIIFKVKNSYLVISPKLTSRYLVSTNQYLEEDESIEGELKFVER